MSRYYRSTSSGIGYPVWSPAVRVLIITCIVVFLLQTFDSFASGPSFEKKFSLVAMDVTERFFLWQLVTYIFLHGGVNHILFNMLGLWMFGSDLERHWGAKQFTRYFFICGIGAGLITVLAETIFPPQFQTSTIGASGAVLGVVLAYALAFPDRIIYYIIFPIPVKWFAALMGGMALFSSFDRTSGVANIAHVGGMAVGFLYLKGGGTGGNLRWRYDRWRRSRMRRNFEVIYNDRDRDRDEPPKWRRWKK